jgi:AGZA family xanthine/uracil permease-like MFS transporter
MYVYSLPPLISSPMSIGIKAGAKTGLSAVICGLLFLVSMFMSPIFQQVPHAGTSPVLLVIGTMLFQNVNRIDWSDIKDAAPAFCVLFFIPFMYSVVEGVLMGYYTYLLIGLFTGDLMQSCIGIVKDYRPALLESFQNKGSYIRWFYITIFA